MFFFINLILIAAAVFFSVNAFYKIAAAQLDNLAISRATIQKETSLGKEVYRPLAYYNVIIERDLFKTETRKKKPPVRIETLEPTTLDLRLWGTVTGNIDRSYAVIEETNRKRRQRSHVLYHLGDIVQNATIKKILWDKVILSVNGKDEILEIEKRSGTKKRRRRAVRPAYQKQTLRRSQIDTAVKNVNTLLKQARIRPHFRNGKPDGLSITGIRANSIFRRMGLRNGDIITGVDGRGIRSVDDVLTLYKSLRSSQMVSLELTRRGRRRVIRYTIR